MNKLRIGLLLAALVPALEGWAGTPKAIMFMLDGMRADAIEAVDMPNVNKLRFGTWQPGYKGCWTVTGQSVPDAAPNSAPNHVSLATGVTASRHRVTVNGQTAAGDYASCPTWLKRVADTGKTATFAYTWSEDGDLGPTPNVTFLGGSDAGNGAALATALAGANCPDAIMYFIDGPDHGGHASGFFPLSADYRSALVTADNLVGACLDAIAARATFAEEDWMIVICADHGGYSTSHGQSADSTNTLNAGCRQAHTIPMVVASPTVQQGRIPGCPMVCDLPMTLLNHFGLNPTGLNGSVLGMTVADDANTALADGLQVYLPFDSTATNNLAPNSTIRPTVSGSTTITANGFHRSFLKIASGGFVKLNDTQSLTYGADGKSFTICCWARIGTQDSDPVLFGNGNWNNGWRSGVTMCAAGTVAGGSVKGVFANLGSGNSSTGRARYGHFDWESTDRWTFYCLTRSSEGVISVYQGRSDGTLDWVAGTYSPLTFNSGAPFCIGQDGTGAYGKKFVGDVDDFALWTRGLSHQEVKRIYEAGRSGVDLGDLIKHDTDAPEMSVSNYDGAMATLAFDGVRTRTYALCVASGTTDAGNSKYAWTDFAKVADIAAETTTYTFAIPAAFVSERRWFRFFLLQTADLPYAGEIEYLQANGNTWLDSDVAPRRDIMTTLDLVFTGQTGGKNNYWDWIFGGRGTSDKKSCYGLARFNGNIWHWEMPGSNTTGGSAVNNTPYHVIFGVDRFEYNGTFISTGATRANFIESGYPMRLFACHNQGADYDKMHYGRISAFTFATEKYAARDFVPVKDANGKGGFFDRVSGRFFGSATATAFVCGPDRDAARLGWERAATESFSADINKPVTATWVGGGAAGDATDPANWRCLNALGNVVGGAVPTAETDVTIAGNTTFGVAAGVTLTAKSITYTDVHLTADLDWRGLADAQLSGYEEIDLGGHALIVGPAQLGGSTYTGTSTETTGELHLVVESGEFVNNFSTLSGNLKLVKEGAGTFVPAKQNQTYSGGTEVRAGTLKQNAYFKYGQLGVNGTTLALASGTVFDANGQYDASSYVLKSEGAVLTNSGADLTQTAWGNIGRLTLTADTTVNAGHSMVFYPGSTDLGGKTLEFNIGGGKSLSFNHTAVSNGTMRLVSGGYFNMISTCDARTADLIQDGTTALKVDGTFNVRNYTVERGSGSNSGNGALNVFGTFLPRHTGFFGCTLQDGATIDLSEQVGTWNAANPDMTGGRTAVSFAKGATVTVDLHGRTPALGEQIIAWPTMPDEVVFEMDAATAAANPGRRFRYSARGLFFDADPADVTPDFAVWTGGGDRTNLSDPRNWECRNLVGEVIEGAIPSAETTQITVTGETSFSLTAPNPLWKAVRLKGAIALTADADWRGLANFDVVDVTIDLKGHRLFLGPAQLALFANATITDSGDGSSTAYSRYRFRVRKILANSESECCQISEIRLMAGDVNYALAENRLGFSASLGMTGGSTNERYEKLADNNVGTKWCQTKVTEAADCYVEFTYDHPVALSDYDWWSANDTGTNTGRSPVSWALQGSNDGVTWVDLDVQTDNDHARRTNQVRGWRRSFVTPGELHLDIPAGQTSTISTTVISGNLQVVKEGAGTLVNSRNQVYRGGFHIVAGTAKSGITHGGFAGNPEGIGEIEVDAGAVMDAWSRNMSSNRIILHGGTFANTRNSAVSDMNETISDIFLTADSAMPFDGQTSVTADKFVQPGSIWDFGGSTLTILLQGYDPDICACQAGSGSTVYGPLTLINGTVKTVANTVSCWWQDRGGVNGTRGGSLYLNNVIRLHANGTVSNLTINATKNDTISGNKTTAFAYSVYGTLKVISTNWCPNVVMLNGSRIDLRDNVGAWASDNFPGTNASNPGVKKITYADGATVTIDLRGRDLETGEKVVAWTAKPENAASLKFMADRGGDRPVKLRIANDGLYFYPANLAIFIR